MDIITLPWFFAAGSIAGLLAGMLGIGGGIIVVPMLAEIFLYLNLPEVSVMHTAVASSLAIMVLTTWVATRRHLQANNVVLPAVYSLAPALVAGAFIGAQITDLLPTDTLRNLFAVFLILVSINLLQQNRNSETKTYKLPDFGKVKFKFVLTGLVIGTISALLGIGGGVLMVPYLLHQNFSFRQAAGTSAASALPIAVAAVLGHAYASFDVHTDIPAVWGYFHLPAIACVAVASIIFAPLGVKLLHYLPSNKVKVFFAIVLIAMALRLFSQGML